MNTPSDRLVANSAAEAARSRRSARAGAFPRLRPRFWPPPRPRRRPHYCPVIPDTWDTIYPPYAVANVRSGTGTIENGTAGEHPPRSGARPGTLAIGMGEPAGGNEDMEAIERERGLTRADAIASRERILAAAAALAGDRRMSMVEVAAAAGIGRSTLYRHFPSRQALERGVRARAEESGKSLPSGRVATMPFRSPGQLGREGPLPLEVTHVLDEVPPHLVPDQLVAEARRASGVPVALYVVDIDGSQLVRLAGSEDFPADLEAPPALGPEIVPEGLPSFQARLRQQLPGCTLEPLWLRGRVTALFLCVGTPITALDDIAKQGAAALELANDYTDFIEAARRRKPTTPAAEIQQNLFPPRIARIAGAQLAGGLLPTYEVGGDWFDFVENRDGAWFAIADAAGTGPTAAGLGAAALGALRAARRSDADLEQALGSMHETVQRLGNPDFFVTALVARWRAPTTTFTWVNCGHPHAYLVDVNGNVSELKGPVHPPLGTGDEDMSFTLTERQLASDERVILVTDGITERHTEGGGRFGIEGIRRAVAELENPTAAATAMAILQAVTDCWREPLEDDGTVVVLCVA
jgi:serine phosphatase RsbU (regulator of sigma subunit)